MNTSIANTRIVVRCADGRIRHLSDPTVDGASFTSQHAASVWADQGHICLAHHTFERIETLGSEGCIVLSGIDGPTYDDCSCTSCRVIQAAAQAEDEGYFDEGPTCSICDAVGHGYPGGPPCPLEITDYSGEPWWAL